MSDTDVMLAGLQWAGQFDVRDKGMHVWDISILGNCERMMRVAHEMRLRE